MQESRSVCQRPTVPVECGYNASSVSAVDQSPGSNRTGSAVPVPCRPTNEEVDVADELDDDQRDSDVDSRLEQMSLHSLSSSASGSQTVPARIHLHHQRSRQRTPLRSAINCDAGSEVF